MIPNTGDSTRLTKITMVSNIDGVHTIERDLGYVAEDAFVVLSALMFDYYVIKYNSDTLYKLYEVSYDNAIGIYDIGRLDNPIVYSTNHFDKLSGIVKYTDIDKARIYTEEDGNSEEEKYNNKKNSNNYLEILSSIKAIYPYIQKAIDVNDIIDIGKSYQFESVSYIIECIHKIASYMTEDKDIMMVILWAFKQMADSPFFKEF